MNVLHISTDYNRGTHVYKTLITELNKSCDNKVFVPLSNSREEYISEDVCEIPCFGQIDRLLYFSKQNKLLKALTERYNPEDFDIVCAHTLFSTGYSAYRLHEMYGIPYTVSVINTDLNLFLKKMVHLRKTGMEILKNAEAVIFISKPYRDFVIEKYVPESLRELIRSKSYVIPFAIDQFYINNMPESKAEPEDRQIRLIQVSRYFDKNKNFDVTARAAAVLRDKGFDVQLTAVGNMTDKDISDYSGEYDFFRHIPFCDKEELVNHLRSNHVFITPSRRETFGLVYPEAMSQGLPVIYTRGQGFDGNFEEGEIGYSSDPYDPCEIAERVINIVSDYEAMSERCINGVQKFSSESVAGEYFDVFNRILKQKGGAANE